MRSWTSVVRKMLPHNAVAMYDRSPSVSDVENWLARAAAGVLLLTGVSRRSAIGGCLAVSSTPLLYRGIPTRGTCSAMSAWARSSKSGKNTHG